MPPSPTSTARASRLPKKAGIKNLVQLDKARICVTRDTTYQQNTLDWFAGLGMSVRLVLFDKTEATFAAFVAGECDAVTQQSTGLVTAIVGTGKADDYMVLPEVISKEPHGPYVRAGDNDWIDIVRWTHNARLEQRNSASRRRTSKASATRARCPRAGCSASTPATASLLASMSSGPIASSRRSAITAKATSVPSAPIRR